MTEHEREREVDRGPDMDGEELVDGTGGGTENVVDAQRETKDIGRLIVAVLVALLALVLLAVPVAWAVGALVFSAGSSDLGRSMTAVYAILLFVLGIGAAFVAYALQRTRVHDD